ncbi:MAG: aromatic ring-hydroxylating dioxygenase subunit alpha [Sphingomonadales bacterium]|nr:aromatic ring-hydroxylating dioxygenase subunit alpha [Sphingomonadales bacterium]
MQASPDNELRAVPFAVTRPDRIPAPRYYDEAFFKLEEEHVWGHVWQMACRAELVAETGDWIEYSNLGRSVLVVNTGKGIRAYHNACRHRGVPLAGGIGAECGKPAFGNCASQGFICPFHGWRWNMHGENTWVYGEHMFAGDQLDPEELKLVECRSEVWGGFVWINHDDDAPSVRESLGPVAQRLEAHNVDRLRAEWHYATVLPANWKTAMEAFMEGYHVRTTHPQLHEVLHGLYADMYGPRDASGAGTTEDNLRKAALPGTTTREAIDGQIEHMRVLNEGMAGMIHAKELAIMESLRDTPLPDDPNVAVPMFYGKVMAAITERLRAAGEPVPDLLEVAQSAPIRAVEFLFPHVFLLPIFTSMSAYRVRPLGPESCLFEIWSLTMFPEGEEPEPVMEPVVLPYDSAEFPPIPRQDYSNIPIQQRGLHARGFEYMRLAAEVEGLISNYQRLIDGYIAGRPAAELATAQHWLGGNFDSVIHDIWAKPGAEAVPA